jgi:hypothetical protein
MHRSSSHPGGRRWPDLVVRPHNVIGGNRVQGRPALAGSMVANMFVPNLFFTNVFVILAA